jgi:superfamily II RNA helicase
VVAAAVVFEPRKNQRMPPGISKSSGRLKKICEETYDRIKNKERRYRIHPFSKLPYFHLCSGMEAWLRGTSFDKTVRFTDCDEGEIVRYFRMSVQVLREISEAPVASYLLKDKIKETIRVINRDIVDAEKQLREG